MFLQLGHNTWTVLWILWTWLGTPLQGGPQTQSVNTNTNPSWEIWTTFLPFSTKKNWSKMCAQQRPTATSTKGSHNKSSAGFQRHVFCEQKNWRTGGERLRNTLANEAVNALHSGKSSFPHPCTVLRSAKILAKFTAQECRALHQPPCSRTATARPPNTTD